TKPETINYRTFKPERDGLFDERIFGPARDYECACGKYKRVRYKGVICDKCGVEVTASRVRRERMGHITLASPVVHVWFFKGIPSKLASLLNLSPRSLESVIYFSSFIVTAMDGAKKAEAISLIEEDLQKELTIIDKRAQEKADSLQKEFDASKKELSGFALEEAQHKLRQTVQRELDTAEKTKQESEKTYRIMQKKIESIDIFTVLSDVEYSRLSFYLDEFATVEIGASAIEGILDALDLDALSSELKNELEGSKGQKAVKISKRLKVVEGFRRASIDPKNMILHVVPVIPPDLRPMVMLDGGRFATSDLNDLYRRVINRNNRLKRLLDLGAPEIIVRNEKRMLQEAVDALFDSSKQRQTNRNPRGKKQLRSLADMLKGKQGRFRQNLLGKRVDYSGRSVIVNGPKLKLNECGLPKEMALELFKPFILRELLARGFAPNVKSAKFVLEARGPEVWDILEELVQDHPVLLNRAPTLWRLGIQAFYPKLIEGNAVQIHLCVCSGFNADFDGDQMAVHLPLSQNAIKEAKELMISTENLLQPSDGSPKSVPARIILFGLYFMTKIDENLDLYPSVFADYTEVMFALDSSKTITLQQRIKVRYKGEILETTPGRLILNSYMPESFDYINEAVDKNKVSALLEQAFATEDKIVIIELIDTLKDLGLEYGTMSGHSVSLADVEVSSGREALIEKGKEEVAQVDKNFKRGLITPVEASRLTQGVWSRVTSDVDDLLWENLPKANPIKVLMSSKATRASRDQLNQIGGVRGLISDPTGKIVELPILGNYKNGLTGLEYFVSSRGARKGLVDKGLKTADAGYLTRRLVDVSQDVIIRAEDCGIKEGMTIKVGEKTLLTPFSQRYVGRYLAKAVKVDGKTIADTKELLTKQTLQEIEAAGVDFIEIRTPVKCATHRGLCAKCYGIDLMTQRLVKVGAAVGIAAAQSIGEPGTQLTMRTFHSGGIAKKDITQGLPRIEEIVEARLPKNLAIMSEITGTVHISIVGDERKVTVVSANKSKTERTAVEYSIDPLAELVVEDGQLIAKGEKITTGHLDLTELLTQVGLEATQKYIIDEVQSVYASQGVSIDDKHIEVIAAQMFNNVKVLDPGDTTLLAGETVTLPTLNELNAEVDALDGKPARFKRVLLGITKASLQTDSFLSAASFIQTSNVLTDAAASGKVDTLSGLKENVILGRLIPTGTRAKLQESVEE
ncbi:DNA-directed RNA polymerase subunit beta', partial [candidate division WWE3 bacterium]|nr:DNA-directed RNA polymerase subunit beta' [candidate division WWE3 bacterium]